MRKRFGEVTRHQIHDHQDVRQFIIRAAFEGLDRPIVVLGDSIVEMARLPDTLCGRPVVNAGIGGATSADFIYLAPRLLKGVKPAFLVVALGANDDNPKTAQGDYGALLNFLRSVAPRVLAIPTSRTAGDYRSVANSSGIPFLEVPMTKDMMIDDVHYNATGYRHWITALVDATTTECARETKLSN
jgi:hypothetical protein